MKKDKRFIVILLCLTLLFAGCGAEETVKKEEKPQKTEDEVSEETAYQAELGVIEPAAYGNAEGLDLEPGSYISIIGKSETGYFWEQVQAGIKRAEEDINSRLGYKGKDKIKVTYIAPAESDSVDEQVNILDEELARYPVALGISVIDTQACGVQFDLAADSGIPVVAFDSGSDYQGLMATVSTDNIGSAAKVGENLAEMMSGSGEVIIFAHDSKSQTGQQRMEGFQTLIREKYPGVTVSAVYSTDNLTAWQEQMAAEIIAGTYLPEGEAVQIPEGEEIAPESITEEEVLDYILAKYPNAKGFYGTSEDSVKLMTAALERNKKEDAFVVGYDVNEEMLEMLKSGTIDGLLVQNPFGMGYAAVIAASRAALELGNEAYVNTGYTWVTRENMKKIKL